jgi:hypothetical protein
MSSTGASSTASFRELLQGRLAEAREFFLLREAEARAGRLDPEIRVRLARDLQVGSQRLEAAQALFRQDMRAEGLRLAHDGFAIVSALAQELDVVVEGPVVARARAAVSAPLPSLDHDVTPEDDDRFAAIVDGFGYVERSISPIALDRAARSRQRILRIGGTVLALVAALVITVVLTARNPLTATASGAYNDRYEAANAVDHSESTNWLLPDHQLGYIDLVPARAARYRTVGLLNVRDMVNYATDQYQVEVWSSGRVIKTIDGSFGPLNTRAPWVWVDLGVSEPVEKIRFHVKTYHQLGGGLAEASLR